MSQAAKTIADGSGAAVLAAVNATFSRFASMASGTARPSDIEAGEEWRETDNPGSGVHSVWLYDGASDVLQGLLDTSAHVYTPVGPTQSANDNSTKMATTAYADAAATAQAVQMVSTVTGAVAIGSTLMVIDDTIPQNTEGDQYMSLAITPRSTTSKLVIEVVANLATQVGAVVILMGALFKDSDADAIGATMAYMGDNQPTALKIRHVMTSGTTSAITFKFRAGNNTGGTTTFNGYGGVRKLGGVLSSSIVIREYL